MKKIYLLITLILILTSFTFTQNVPKYSQPVLVTSAGQSADVSITGTLLKKAGVTFKSAPLAKEDDLGDAKTIIVVPGFSSKGLGAAGISREDEMNRIKSLLTSAKSKKIKILLLHLGGKARRGGQSDDFNKLAAENAEYMIVVNQGNEDQFFTKISESKKTGLKLVDKMVEVIDPLKKLFQ